MANDWRWAFWILLWLDGFCLLVLAFTMPETSSANILTRRAQRLRKLTGNDKLKSQAEMAGEKMQLKDIAHMSLVRPFVLIFTEPICLACHLYIGLVYSILYAFIESFALVYTEMYGFNLGENGLAYRKSVSCFLLFDVERIQSACSLVQLCPTSDLPTTTTRSPSRNSAKVEAILHPSSACRLLWSARSSFLFA